MIPLESQSVLQQELATKLAGRIRLDFFTQRETVLLIPGREPCASCKDAEELIGDLARLSTHFTLTEHEWGADPEAEKRLGVERVPAIVLRGVLNRPLIFYGLPMPPLFSAVVSTALLLAQPRVRLSAGAEKRLRNLREIVQLRVFVANGAEFCAEMVQLAFAFGAASKQVRVEAIEVGSFPELAQRLRLSQVPLTTINAQVAIPGLVSPETLAEQIFQAVTHRALTVERPEILGVTTLESGRDPTGRPAATRPSGLVIPGR